MQSNSLFNAVGGMNLSPEVKKVLFFSNFKALSNVYSIARNSLCGTTSTLNLSTGSLAFGTSIFTTKHHPKESDNLQF